MSTPEYPTINGFYPSWAEISCRLAGKSITDFKSVKWDESVEIGEVYGAGPLKRGTTRGQYKPGKPSIELYLDAADTFEERLTGLASDGQSITLVQFAFKLQWVKRDGRLTEVDFEGCRVVKVGQDSKQGTDAEARPYDLDITRIIRKSNGIKRGLLLSAG